MNTIVDIKNGKPPEDINENRNPPYLCQKKSHALSPQTRNTETHFETQKRAPYIRSVAVNSRCLSGEGRHIQFLDKKNSVNGTMRNFKKFEPNVIAIANNILHGTNTKIQIANTFYFDNKHKLIQGPNTLSVKKNNRNDKNFESFEHTTSNAHPLFKKSTMSNFYKHKNTFTTSANQSIIGKSDTFTSP